MQSRGWCFTLNNYTKAEVTVLAECAVEYMVYGREVGNREGTQHLQGYLYLPKKKVKGGMKKILPRAHWEIAKGSPEQNRTYCTKDGIVTERGKMPDLSGAAGGARGGEAEKKRWDDARTAAKTGKMDDVPADIYVRYYRTLKEIGKDHMVKPDDATDVTGVWYWGDAGAGKSRKAREDYPNSYLKMANKWWDGYQQEDTVILDDIDTNHACLGHHLKIWADRYSFLAETKGGAIAIRPKKFVVTSQFHPDKIWHDKETRDALARRFKFTEFKTLKANDGEPVSKKFKHYQP